MCFSIIINVFFQAISVIAAVDPLEIPMPGGADNPGNRLRRLAFFLTGEGTSDPTASAKRTREEAGVFSLGGLLEDVRTLKALAGAGVRIPLLEREIATLKRDKGLIETQLSAEQAECTRLRGVEATLRNDLFDKIKDLNVTIAARDSEIAVLEPRLASLQAQLRTTRDDLADREAKIIVLRNDVASRDSRILLEDQILTITQERDRLLGDVAKLRGDLNDALAKLTAREQTLMLRNSEIAVRDTRIMGLRSDLATRQLALEVEERNSRKLTDDVGRFSKTLTDKADEIRAIGVAKDAVISARDATIAALEGDVIHWKGQFGTVTGERDNALLQTSSLQECLSSREGDLNTKKAELLVRDGRIKNLEDDLLSQNNQLASVRIDLSARDAIIGTLRSDLVDVNDMLRKSGQETKDKEAELERDRATFVDEIRKSKEEIDRINKQHEVDAKMMREALAARDREIQSRDAKIASIESSLAILQAEIVSTKEERDRLLLAAQDLKTKLAVYQAVVLMDVSTNTQAVLLADTSESPIVLGSTSSGSSLRSVSPSPQASAAVQGGGSPAPKQAREKQPSVSLNTVVRKARLLRWGLREKQEASPPTAQQTKPQKKPQLKQGGAAS